MSAEPFLASIALFAGNFAPRGWAFCAGQIMSIAQNTALFSLLGTTYGGNGQTTFALPDLRGRAPIGAGLGPGLSNVDLGQAGGTQNVTLLNSNMPMHNHSLNASSTAAAVGAPGSTVVLGDSGTSQSGGLPVYIAAAPDVALLPGSIGFTGNNIPFSVESPYLGINYIIALEGIFPSRN
jgi:microcystin-dependent protein